MTSLNKKLKLETYIEFIWCSLCLLIMNCIGRRLGRVSGPNHYQKCPKNSLIHRYAIFHFCPMLYRVHSWTLNRSVVYQSNQKPLKQSEFGVHFFLKWLGTTFIEGWRRLENYRVFSRLFYVFIRGSKRPFVFSPQVMVQSCQQIKIQKVQLFLLSLIYNTHLQSSGSN